MITTVKPGVGFESQTIYSAGLEPVDQVLSASDGSEQDNSQKVASFIEAIAPLTFDDAVLAGFRKEYRFHATQAAQKTLAAGASATQTILQMTGWIQEMRSRLNRKEFSAFVKELLQWVGDEARPYLDIARTFSDFDLTRLQKLEPFTLLKLRSKRYFPVVERLREESEITPRRVQELISELIPKQPRRNRAENEHKERQEYADAVLQRHADVESGTFYYTLKEVKLSDRVGSWLESKLESQNIGQILAQVASRPQSDYVLDQLQELQDVVEHARALDTENRKLTHQLQQQESRIAELEARLAEGVTACSAIPKETRQASHSDDNGSFVVVERDDVQEYLNSDQSTQTFSLEQSPTWEEVAAAVGCDRNQLLKTVKNWTLEQRQVLVKLLSAYLEREPLALEHIAWIPKNLLDKALSTLSFKVRKIGGPNNLVDDPKIEYIHNCSFVSLEYPGTRSEQWIFQDSNNKLYPVFGRDDLEIELRAIGARSATRCTS